MTANNLIWPGGFQFFRSYWPAGFKNYLQRWYITNPFPFFEFCPSPSNLLKHYYSFALVFWMNGRSHHIWCAIQKDLAVFYATRYKSHTHTHTQHTQRPIDWHTHINIYQHHLLCAHSSYLYYTVWLIPWDQKCALRGFTMPLVFKNYSLIEVTCLLISFNKNKSFPQNTKNTGRNSSVNKQNAHTNKPLRKTPPPLSVNCPSPPLPSLKQSPCILVFHEPP